jgi:hypothetical protein
LDTDIQANPKEVIMLPDETIASGADPTCCGGVLTLRVLKSGGGYYIGTMCPNCGPYSRESGYYATPEAAKADLDSGVFSR